MPKNDYHRIVYVILKELYRCMKNGERIDTEELSHEALGIPEAYRNDILEEILTDGYVKGFKIKEYINGREVVGIENISITSVGIEYLRENTNMKKVEKWIKTAKDIIPRI